MRDLVYEIAGLITEPITLGIKKLFLISEDIDTEVDEGAYHFGHYAVLAEKAETRYQKMKFQYEGWRAEVETRIAKDRALKALKSFTEAQMKAEVMSHLKYRAFQAKLIQYDEDRRLLKIIAKGLEMKKDLIQTKSSNRRGELKGR